MIKVRENRLALLAVAAAAGVCLLNSRTAPGQSPAALGELPRLPTKTATKFIIEQPTPDYPVLAKVNYIQGQVRLLALVTSSGGVAEAHVVKGHPFLAAAALNAVRRWLFRPAKSRPGPPEFQTFVDVHFTLRARKLEQIPSEAERDLDRQVHPPVLLERLAGPVTGRIVRLRVLVSADGHTLDAQPLPPFTTHVEDARRVVAHWNFRPARWGALQVPWYLDVDVPVDSSPAPQGAADSGGH